MRFNKANCKVLHLDQGNPHYQHKLEFKIEYKEKLFYSEGGEALKRLPRDVVDVPLLEAFKARLDQALGIPSSCTHPHSLQGCWTR